MGKESEEIIMAGFGGQGVLFLGKVLAEVGLFSGRNVSWIPSYGPEMRGGTANCTVIISQNPIASPIVYEPDTVIALNKPSVTRFLPKIKGGGTLLYNSSLIQNEKMREDVKAFGIPANSIAEEIGNPKVANLVMAGAYIRHCPMLKFDDVMKALPKIIPAKKKEMAEINKAALTRGYEYNGN